VHEMLIGERSTTGSSACRAARRCPRPNPRPPAPVVESFTIELPPWQAQQDAACDDPPRHHGEMKLPLTGGCNCGAVRYEVSEPLVRASYCHCRRCQRRSGAAASAQAHPAPESFRIVAGEDRLRVWRPESGGEKWFCGECGSALFGSNPAHPESIGIRMGTFDDDPGIRPSVRQFVAYAAPWEPIPDDGLPRFPESRHASDGR
jgi:hypothetical protein